MEFSFSDIDWRSLLLKRYRGYGLGENEVMVLLVADQIQKIDPTAPITSETLSGYMTITSEEIDACLERLMNRKLIAYVIEGTVAKLSFEGLFNKLFADLQKDITLKRDDGGKRLSEIHAYLLQELNRPSFSPVEQDKIAAMVSEGATIKMFRTAVNNIRSKSNRVTMTRLSQEILRLEKESDFDKEGYTVRNEVVRDTRKLNETLAHDWVNDDSDGEE